MIDWAYNSLLLLLNVEYSKYNLTDRTGLIIDIMKT